MYPIRELENPCSLAYKHMVQKFSSCTQLDLYAKIMFRSDDSPADSPITFIKSVIQRANSLNSSLEYIEIHSWYSSGIPVSAFDLRCIPISEYVAIQGNNAATISS